MKWLFRDCIAYLDEQTYVVQLKSDIYLKLLQAAAVVGKSTFSHDDSALTEEAFFEHFFTLHQNATKQTPLIEFAESTLAHYCATLDPYSKYLKASDYRIVQLLSRSQSSGIGLSLTEKKEGFYCYPLPDSAASRAGIKAGDELLEVDGKPIKDHSIEAVASLIRGTPDSKVELRVMHSFGRAQKIRITREPLNFPTSFFEKTLTGHVLKIRKFDVSLIKEAQQYLGKIQKWGILTIDMRGCSGGDLDVAVEFASMFLQKDQPIVTLKTRHKNDEQILSENSTPYHPEGIVILQDGGTASAAELVIAALMASPHLKVSTDGEKSYGKGITQQFFELNSGGALKLSTHLLVAPQGKSWDQIGLLPSLQNNGKIFKSASETP